MRNVVEEGPDTAAGLAAGRLDLDDVRPQIPEELAAELARLIGEFENAQPCERARPKLIITHASISSR